MFFSDAFPAFCLCFSFGTGDTNGFWVGSILSNTDIVPKYILKTQTEQTTSLDGAMMMPYDSTSFLRPSKFESVV